MQRFFTVKKLRNVITFIPNSFISLTKNILDYLVHHPHLMVLSLILLRAQVAGEEVQDEMQSQLVDSLSSVAFNTIQSTVINYNFRAPVAEGFGKLPPCPTCLSYRKPGEVTVAPTYSSRNLGDLGDAVVISIAGGAFAFLIGVGIAEYYHFKLPTFSNPCRKKRGPRTTEAEIKYALGNSHSQTRRVPLQREVPKDDSDNFESAVNETKAVKKIRKPKKRKPSMYVESLTGIIQARQLLRHAEDEDAENLTQLTDQSKEKVKDKETNEAKKPAAQTPSKISIADIYGSFPEKEYKLSSGDYLDFIYEQAEKLAVSLDEKKNEASTNIKKCIRHLATLFRIQRLYLWLVKYTNLDRHNKPMYEGVFALNVQLRHMLAHRAMEVSIKTLMDSFDLLRNIVPRDLSYLRRGARLAYEASDIESLRNAFKSKPNAMFDALEESSLFPAIESFRAKSKPADLKLGEEKIQQQIKLSQDRRYYSWLMDKIVPMINLIAAPLLAAPRATHLRKHFSEEFDALIKLFSFVGEYATKSRCLRFKSGGCSVDGVTPSIGKLLTRIRLTVRNRAEHVDDEYPHVIADGKLLKLCVAVQQITSKQADLSDFTDAFTFSLYQKTSALKPGMFGSALSPFAPQFVPGLQPDQRLSL